MAHGEIFRRLHYDHHEDPQNLRLLFLPVWYSIPNFLVVFAASWLITRSLPLAACVTVGGLTALAYYEWTHYVAHRPIIPRTRWGRWMKKYHLWHHFKNEHFWFGVTNPSLDFLAGTYRNVHEVETESRVRYHV